MLTKCPECDLQVSGKAISCPHCGYPLNPVTTRRTRKKAHKRLPNGFGQITKLSNKNLRNPYRVMVTVGKTETGKCIQKLLKPQAYFKTYNDAYSALIEYNKNPYDFEESITLKTLYERWSTEYFAKTAPGSVRTMNSAWNYCSSIYKMRVKDLRARHIKGVMEQENVSASTKERIKSLFNIMLDYALEYELVDRNYARTFALSKDVFKEIEKAKQPHINFTDEEMKILWANINETQYVDLILFQCYSGLRPQELGLIRLENVNLENWTMICGMKTEAGTDRLVPLHPKIRHIVQKYYDEAKDLGSDYLINCTDTHTHRSSLKMTYDKYRKRFIKIVEIYHLNPDHRAHDGRMHFISMAKKAGLDEYAIKYIVGHAITDITEKIYTVREIEWLISEMQKIQ